MPVNRTLDPVSVTVEGASAQVGAVLAQSVRPAGGLTSATTTAKLSAAGPVSHSAVRVMPNGDTQTLG